MSELYPNNVAHKCLCPRGGRNGSIHNDTIYCGKCDGVIAHIDNLTLDEMNQLMIEGKALATKIPVTYIDTSIKCDPNTSGIGCNYNGHSWFNHSQVGLRGGAYPPDYKGELDR